MTYSAIETKVLHPTNHRGTRIKAVEMDIMPSREKPISLIKPYDYGLDVFENHKKVAFELHLKVCTYVLNNGCIHKINYGSTKSGYVSVSTLPKENGME